MGKKKKKKEEDPEKVIQRTEKYLEQFWNLTVQCWYTVDEDRGKRVVYQDKSCVELQMSKVEARTKLEGHILKKLGEPAFFK